MKQTKLHNIYLKTFCFFIRLTVVLVFFSFLENVFYISFRPEHITVWVFIKIMHSRDSRRNHGGNYNNYGYVDLNDNNE
jgi:hypothetical protein